jgi:hypothetical protein
MKSSLKFFFLLLLSTSLFTSCEKEHNGHDKKRNEVKNVTLDITINAGELYTLDLIKYGDADDIPTITTQANAFTVSEIAKIGVIGTYNFKKDGTPKVGGNGTEKVVLKVAEPANRCHIEETDITINFTIL